MFETTDEQYKAIFGDFERKGEKTPDTADPEDKKEADDESEKTSDVADPNDDDEKDDDSDDSSDDDDEDETDKSSNDDDNQQKNQSQEDNSKYAAARRKAEEKANAAIEDERRRSEAIIKAEKDKASALQVEINKFYSSQHLTNAFKNDNPITNKAEYEEFLDMEAESEIRQGNVLPEYIARVANKGKTQQPALNVHSETETQMRERIDSEVKQKYEIQKLIDKDLAEIMTQDPEVKKFEDIFSRPYGAAVNENLKNRMTLKNAFLIGAKDFLIEKETKRAVADAKEKDASKKHLKTPGGRGTTKEYPVPPDTLENYRSFFPNRKDKQLREMYAKDQEIYGPPGKK